MWSISWVSVRMCLVIVKGGLWRYSTVSWTWQLSMLALFTVQTKSKRTEFIRSLGLSMIYERLISRKWKKNIPSYIRQRIEKLLGEPLSRQVNKSGHYVRYQDCPYKKDRKTKHSCKACGKHGARKIYVRKLCRCRWQWLITLLI